MANNWYVRSSAAGTANGAEWTDAYLSVNAALLATNTAPGDFIWVSDDHAEVYVSPAQTNIYTVNTNRTNPTYILCANHTSGNVPPQISTDLTTTANITSEGSSLNIGNGAMSFYGIHFNAGLGGTTALTSITFGGIDANTNFQKFDSCSFQQYGNTTSTGLTITFGAGTPEELLFSNCSWLITSAHSFIRNQNVKVTMKNCSLQTNTLANSALTYLFQNPSGSTLYGGEFRFRGCDFSQANVGNLLWSIYNANPIDYRFDECNIPNVVTALITTNEWGVLPLQMSGCGGQYEETYADFYGQTNDSNTIYRIGGAVDGLGIGKSRWVQPTGNSSFTFPFTAGNPLTKWNNDTTDTITASVYGTWANTTLPLNNQIWLEIEYYANNTDQTKLSSSSLGGNNELLFNGYGTPASLTYDTYSRWINGFGSSGNTFVIQTTFQAANVGYVKAYVRTSLTPSNSTPTFYFDPVLYLANSSGGAVGNTASVTYDTGIATVNETQAPDTPVSSTSSVAFI